MFEYLETEQAPKDKHFWAPDEVSRLKELVDGGASSRAIAGLLGRSQDSIEHKRRHIGMTPKPSRWTPAIVEELKRLAAEGLSGSEIGDRLGFTRDAIIGKCDRIGIKLLGANRCKSKTKGPRKRKRNYAAETARRAASVRPAFVWQDAPAPVEPLRIGLGDLGPIHCRAVVDGETDDDCYPLYCGHPIAYRSYCAAHARVSYRWGR